MNQLGFWHKYLIFCVWFTGVPLSIAGIQYQSRLVRELGKVCTYGACGYYLGRKLPFEEERIK